MSFIANGSNQIIGAVEIGTAKVIVLVGEINRDLGLSIIGMGQCSSMGVRKGEIVDFHSVCNATHAAITAAEKNAKTKIEKVFLAQTGGHIQGFSNRSSVTVSSPDGLVSKSDILRVIENATRKELSADRLYIKHIQNGFYLDNRRVENPLSMRGEQLEVRYWNIHGDEQKISDLIHVVNGFSLPVEEIIVSSIASGCMVTNETERRNGVLVLDIGCGTTDYVLYRDGYIYKTGVIQIGGDHLTNDLSVGLRVNNKQAEKLKIKEGKAIVDVKDKDEFVWLFGDFTIGDRKIPRKAVYQIIQARVEEIFTIVKEGLREFLLPDILATGVVLTGGTSLLPFIADEASRVLDLPVRISTNNAHVKQNMNTPEYSTVLGLLHYGIKEQFSKEKQKSNTSFLSKVAGFFKLE
jgi:cell division protein FtsA